MVCHDVPDVIPGEAGEDPYQHGQDFLSRVEELRKQKYTYTDEDTGTTYSGDTAIAKALGLTTTQFRTEISIATSERRLYNVNTAKRLRDKEGLSNSEIARKMGLMNLLSVIGLMRMRKPE